MQSQGGELGQELRPQDLSVTVSVLVCDPHTACRCRRRDGLLCPEETCFLPFVSKEGLTWALFVLLYSCHDGFCGGAATLLTFCLLL